MVIDAQEDHDVAIAVIPNAFIQTHLTQDDDKVVMQLHGPLMTLLVDIASNIYSPYFTTDKNGQPALYV